VKSRPRQLDGKPQVRAVEPRGEGEYQFGSTLARRSYARPRWFGYTNAAESTPRAPQFREKFDNRTCNPSVNSCGGQLYCWLLRLYGSAETGAKSGLRGRPTVLWIATTF
jgi:hypothetical protein